MLIEFSPKSNYQGFHGDCAEELQRQSAQRWFTVSLAYALAEMSWAGASGEKMAGANMFIMKLRLLPEKEDAHAEAFPKRELTTLDEQTKQT